MTLPPVAHSLREARLCCRMSSSTANMSIGVDGLCVRQTAASAAALRRASEASTTTTGSNNNKKPSCSTRREEVAGSATNHVGTPLPPEQLRALEELREEAQRYVDAENVPFRLLKRVCEVLREENSGGGGGPWLQDLVRGESGGIALEAPKRPPRNPELEARCQKLRDELEQKAYDEMTKDVTGMGRRRGGDGALKMSTMTREIGFGAHVITVMGACFAGGVVAGEAPVHSITIAHGDINNLLALVRVSDTMISHHFVITQLITKKKKTKSNKTFPPPLPLDTVRWREKHSAVSHSLSAPLATLTTGRSIAPDNQTVQVVLGMVGGFVALVVEALLFIIRDGKT